jgi:hypothetical protein
MASFPQASPPTPCTQLYPPPICVTCPVHLIRLDFTTRTILGKKYRSFSSSLISYTWNLDILLLVLYVYTHICVVICYGSRRLSVAILHTCQTFRVVSLLRFTALSAFIPELCFLFPSHISLAKLCVCVCVYVCMCVCVCMYIYIHIYIYIWGTR